MCIPYFDITDATRMLQSNDIAIQSTRINTIIGAKSISKIDDSEEELLRIENPFHIQNINGCWFTTFVVGQRLVPIKASVSLNKATLAVIDLFHLSIVHSENTYATLIPLLLMYDVNLISEIISDNEIIVYEISDYTSHLEKLGESLNSPKFRENSKVAVIRIDEQGCAVRFERGTNLFKTVLVSNIEEAARLIIDKI